MRTLHGLAHDIVRERPALVGLADDFQIIDEREADRIRQEAASAWLRSHPDALDDYLDPELDEGQARLGAPRAAARAGRQTSRSAFIRSAKDLRLTPERLRQRLDDLPVPLPLAEMGCADLRRLPARPGLPRRGGFRRPDPPGAPGAGEPTRITWNACATTGPTSWRTKPRTAAACRRRSCACWPGPTGNWVRVGDPNQAIYETFTTASPHYLRDFMRQPACHRARAAQLRPLDARASSTWPTT